MKRVPGLFGNRKTRRAPVRGGVRRRLGFDPLEQRLAPASLSIGDATIVEGNAGASNVVFTVSLSAASGQSVQVAYSTGSASAAPGADFTAVSGTLTFAPGETAKTVVVTALGDNLDEDDEWFPISLGNPVNADIADDQGMGTILDDDPTPSLSVADVTIVEGNAGSKFAGFAIVLSAASGRTVTVSYATADGTAAAGSDYTGASGTATFLPGMTSYFIPPMITGDATYEADETFFVNLTQATNATIADAQAVGAIRNDEVKPVLQILDATVTEGDSGVVDAVFTVRLVPASGLPVTVGYSTVNGTATAGSDYSSRSGALTFAPGETTKTIAVPVLGDMLLEPTETFAVNLTSPTGADLADGSALGTIANDDTLPVLVVGDAAPVTEGHSGSVAVDTTFAVTLSKPYPATVTVNYTTSSVMATAGQDFTVASGTLTFAPGETSKTIVVPVLGDTLDEDDELYTVILRGPSNATIGRSNGGGKILDDDATPTLSIGDGSGPEAGPAATVVVTLSAPSGRTVSVDYWTSEGTALDGSDFAATDGILTFAPGETSKTIDLAAIDDNVKEPDETYYAHVGNPYNVTIAGFQGAVTIVNDDFSRISGTLYDDLDASGTRNAGEGPLAGRTVYVDLDRDGQLDPSEPTSVTDAGGHYGFSGLPPDTYEVRQVVPAGWAASAPGPLAGFTDAWFSLANHRDLVYDAARQLLYATTSDGKIQRYSIATGTVLPAWNVGVSLYGADITPDGRYLYVSEGQAAGNAGLLHKVDLNDGSVTLLTFPFINGYIAGSFDVKIGADGKGLIGSVYFREIDTATDAITTRLNTPGAPNLDRITMSRGADRSTFLMADTGSGQFFTYDATTAGFGPPDDANSLLGSAQVGVNRDSSLLAMEIDGGVSVFDRGYNAVAVLPYDGGFAFDPRGDILYAIDSAGLFATDALVAVDTSRWQVLWRIPLGENLPDSSVFGPGEVTISDDGTQLFLSTTYGVRWFTLPTRGAQRVTLADGQQVSGKDFLSFNADSGSLPTLTVDDPSLVEENDNLQLRDLVFTVSLSSPSLRTVTVGYRIVPGSATLEDNDYSSGTGYAGTLTFSPGQTSKTIVVKVRGDAKDELDETFLLQLSKPTNATIADAQGVATIVNDDSGARGSIAGTAYEDVDRNGFRFAGEPALAGVTVYLDQNANGQLDPWELSTAAGPDGSYSFPNLPGGTYIVAWAVPGGYQSTQAASALVRGTAVGLVSMPDRRDLVFDPTRNLLYITTAHGTVERYDLDTGALLSPIPVGSSLRAADITPDGRYLYVAEGQRGTTQGLIYKVDLGDWSVTPLRYDLIRGEGGTFDLAVGRNGVVLFSATFEGSGFTPIRRIDPVTNAISEVLGSTQDGLVARGPDRGFFYLTQGNISSGTISTYDVDSGLFPKSFSTGDYLSRSVAAVNRTGDLLAVEHGLNTVGVQIYDRNLKLIASPAIGAGGMVFDPVRDLLYASDGINLRAWDSKTWTSRIIGQYDEQSGNSEPFNNGEMAVTPDGNTLFITTPSGVRIIHIDHEVRKVSTFGSVVTGVDLGAARPSTPTVSIDDVTGTEGFNASAHVFSVTLSGPSAVPVTVSYATADGAARAGADYTAASGTITFAPGETGRTIVVPIGVDSLDEPAETFTVALSNASGATIARAQGLGTILDDDLPATLRITGVTVTEGDSGTSNAVFTVSILNTGGSGFTVSVNYTTADTLGVLNKATPNADYALTSGTLTFAPGETSKTISVPVMGDALNEFTESFSVVLSNPTNATVSGSNGTAQGAINDNDPAPSLSINDVTATEGNSGTVAAAFTVTLSAPSGKTVSVSVSGGAAGDTAAAGLDYSVDPVTLTFLPGETTKTINAVVRGDLTDEDDERFSITLARQTNATLSRPRGTGTILDDDLAATASFVAADTATQGNWKGSYGTDGFVLAQDPSANNPSLPSYATVTVAGATPYAWTGSTADPRAPLQASAGSTNRVASTWYSSGSFTIDVNLSDGLSHRVALYALDWDGAQRTETVEVIDATSGAVLDSRTLADFQNGVYLVWNLSGNVRLKVTNTGPANAVATALFFGDAVVPAATASFVATDTATQGNWKGSYGADGFSIAQDPSGNNPSLPAYATVAVAGAAPYTWAGGTVDPRAPLQAAAGSTNRIASTWYSSTSFTIDVNLTDGLNHRVALYALDWDGAQRTATVEVIDVATGAVLDTRVLASFEGGAYLVWNLKGHVRLKVTRTGAGNAVATALFFGDAVVPAASASFVATDTTTQGNWKGSYGADGFSIAQDPSANNPSLPSYATVAVAGAASYTWNGSTADPRAPLQAAAGSTNRIASTWYSGGSFSIDVNLTDGLSHRVALYALDWDGAQRTETVEVIDVATGTLLDARVLADFQNGVYLVWNLKGNVRLRVTNTGPANAVAAALFFG